jgi:NAD(P)-dependent dehydrogenase (short-subunit alcohol dehydrogenase family)
MRTIAMTGSASGIGAATRKLLERGGARVIGCDVRDAEVIADLSTPEGRAGAIDGIREAASGALDGLVLCAGLGPQVAPTAKIVAVNYFGAAGLLGGLRDALAGGRDAAAVAISSNSATISPGLDAALVDACLAGDEAAAWGRAAALGGAAVYAASKLALARFVRRSAVSAAWAGSGIRLNAVAPGAVATPLLQGGLEHAELGAAIRALPIPLGGFGRPEQIAAAIAFLVGPDSGFCCGTIFFADGGSDALLRPDAL